MASGFRAGRNASAGFRIDGIDELVRAFKELPVAISGAVLEDAAAAGAEVIRDEAEARAPVDDGVLKANIVVKRGRGKKKRGTRADATVGPNKKAAHGIPVELGHNVVTHGKNGGRVVGHVPPKPYLRPALQAKKDAAVAAVSKVLEQGLKRVTRGNG